MQDTLVQQGVELMLFGMGTVFVFLGILIVATSMMSKLVQRFSPPEPVATVAASQPSPSATDQQLIAVIAAAIHKYRSKQK